MTTRGWNGLGRMKHRIRRVDLGDLVYYRPTRALRTLSAFSTVWGIWLDEGQLFVLIDLPTGRAWVASQDCDVQDAPGRPQSPPDGSDQPLASERGSISSYFDRAGTKGIRP